MKSNIWQDKELWMADARHGALKALTLYRKGRTFKGEDLYRDLLDFYVDEPSEPRWMGSVVQGLKRDGYIKQVGVSRAATSNRGYKPLWSRA
jgi:hypothetical protein